MELASPIYDCSCRFFELIGKPIGYVRHLEENINSLKGEIRTLVAITRDIEKRVRSEGGQNRQPLEVVSDWLRRVEEWKSGAEDIIAQGEVEIQQKCFFGSCPKNIFVSYKVAKKVVLELPKVIKLQAEGNKFEVFTNEVATLNDEMALGNTVGLDEKVKEVWNSLMDPMKKIIGIYGMGGIGKTTLMKRINNKLATETHDFGMVIWIVASKDLNIDMLQNDIGKKLPVYHDGGKWDKWRQQNRIDKARDIFNFLKEKRFMLLLDDLWEGLELEEVGIPPFSAEENNNAKVLLTTRQEDVCRSMRASASIKIEPLQWEESWTLFMSNVRQEFSDPRIRELAVEVAEHCGGLPLALITVGRTMASKKKPQEWEHAITTLKSACSEFLSMEEKVLSTLKFSYDNLSDEIIKQCFLYCSSFPEDDNIPEDGLISLWIGEGFLDKCDSIYDAENLGHDIIGRLKLACLLEKGNFDHEVKMHDVIRDMALWIATDYGKNKNKILVGNRRMDKVPGTARWKEAQRISFEFCEIKEVDVTPDCSNLSTLRIRRNFKLVKISDTFFQLMTALKVLDLSGNIRLRELPRSLFELSSSLQYLDLSDTGIEEMPVELKNLGKLKYLLLRGINKKLKFPLNVIPSLSMLVRLDFYATSLFPGCDGAVLLDEMECLPDLQSTGVTVESEVGLQKLLSSRKLLEATRELSIKGVQGLTSLELSSLLRNCKRLSEIIIGECDDLEQIVVTINESVEEKNNRATCCSSNLKILYIQNNGALKKLEGVGYIPSLEELDIAFCPALEEIIPLPLQLQREEGDHKALALFPGLKRLKLLVLPKLRSICPPHSNSRPLVVFPLLEHIDVQRCQELRRLPLDTVAIMKNNSSKLREIWAEKYWWAGLRWDDASFTPSLLSPYLEFHDSSD